MYAKVRKDVKEICCRLIICNLSEKSGLLIALNEIWKTVCHRTETISFYTESMFFMIQLVQNYIFYAICYCQFWFISVNIIHLKFNRQYAD